MNTLLNWLDTTDSAEKKNAGYGLIGAYAIVFLGIAVRILSPSLEPRNSG